MRRTYKELQAFAKAWGFVVSTAGLSQPGDGRRYGFYSDESQVESGSTIEYAVGLKEANLITCAIAAGIRVERDRNKMPIVNREKLTLEEWIHCAFFGCARELNPTQIQTLVDAWEKGEDPTEYNETKGI